MKVERVVLPSRIRRGRMATAPVWRVTLESGEVWQFQRRKDAEAFALVGGCPHNTADCWRECRGYIVGLVPATTPPTPPDKEAL